MAKNCGKQAPPSNPSTPRPHTYYRLHTLLHSIRSIAQHEDDLCCLLNEIGSSNEVNSTTSEELRTLLEQLSGLDFQADLNATWRSLSIVPPQRAAKPAPKSNKPSAKASSKTAKLKKPKKKASISSRRAPRTRAA